MVPCGSTKRLRRRTTHCWTRDWNPASSRTSSASRSSLLLSAPVGEQGRTPRQPDEGQLARVWECGGAVPGAAKKEDWMERTARQKASARPSSRATVGRRCAAAGRWALVIGGRDAAGRGGSEAARKGGKGAPAVECGILSSLLWLSKLR